MDLVIASGSALRRKLLASHSHSTRRHVKTAHSLSPHFEPILTPSTTPSTDFTRSISCLTKFGEEIHISASSRQLKLSSINPSRSAFAAVTFPNHFFAKYHVRLPRGESFATFSVVGKALLSPLRPRSANTIETCSISLTGQDAVNSEDEDQDQLDLSQCRIVIRLYCQHGVVKTHRLTYSTSSEALFARANRDNCTSNWIASSRILKEWTEHFHLRSGASGGGSDEISFDLSPESCRLRSFGVDANSTNPADLLAARPISTELSISISDFDSYECTHSSVITFSLKEFKAIIALADSVPSTIDAACSIGGQPILLKVDTDDFKAEFVIATTDFDGDQEPHQQHQTPVQIRPAPVKDDAQRGRNQPLFRNETPMEQDGQDEEDEYGGGLDDLGDDVFAQIDQLTQQAMSQAPSQASNQQPVPMGPTQAHDGAHKGRRESKKQKKWNLLDEDEEFYERSSTSP